MRPFIPFFQKRRDLLPHRLYAFLAGRALLNLLDDRFGERPTSDEIPRKVHAAMNAASGEADGSYGKTS